MNFFRDLICVILALFVISPFALPLLWLAARTAGYYDAAIPPLPPEIYWQRVGAGLVVALPLAIVLLIFLNWRSRRAGEEK